MKRSGVRAYSTLASRSREISISVAKAGLGPVDVFARLLDAAGDFFSLAVTKPLILGMPPCYASTKKCKIILALYTILWDYIMKNVKMPDGRPNAARHGKRIS